MRSITLGLRNFVEDVYGIDIDKVLDYDNFNFESITPDDYDRVRFNKIKAKYNLVIDSDIENEVFKIALNRHYEDSYIEEYSKKFINILEEKIEKDITNIQHFYEDELREYGIEGKLLVKVDWEHDKIIFSGKLTILDVMITECINSYGAFGYTLKSFKKEGSLKERVESHLHWLNKFEEIYGSIYSIFDFHSNIDYYNTFGNTLFSKDDIIDAIDSVA